MPATRFVIRARRCAPQMYGLRSALAPGEDRNNGWYAPEGLDRLRLRSARAGRGTRRCLAGSIAT
ncbi:hypothetical protein Pen02_72580 [Plantactinospora endophytica]|uniref:Uncharacterized protein n=1 Tax=Plantactinospora endophytica TaxID=673535 RepID=A0ABQ4EC68_9ACTN|nr:hypothetical protein Pen02_72580 [Plantactinospora endophytica]